MFFNDFSYHETEIITISGTFGAPIACTDRDDPLFAPVCSLENAHATFGVDSSHTGANTYAGACQLKTVSVLNINNADPYGYFNFDILVKDGNINGVQFTTTVAVSIKVSQSFIFTETDSKSAR